MHLHKIISQKYSPKDNIPIQLHIKVSDTDAAFLDLHSSMSDGFIKNKMFDKRVNVDFDIVNFPFLDGDVPRLTA